MFTHREIVLYACVALLVTGALTYNHTMSIEIFIGLFGTISGYVVRDKEGYIRRLTEDQRRRVDDDKTHEERI